MAVRRSSSVETARRPLMHGGTYTYGNTVKHAHTMPDRRSWEIEQPRRRKKVSHQVRRNRKKALHMSSAYVAFLALAAVIALLMCVWYLQMRAELTSRSENITSLQQELADMKEENTARYNSVIDSVNLEEVRTKAVNELGMVYANQGQIITYQNPVNDYVKQLQEIPKSGILVQSEQVEE